METSVEYSVIIADAALIVAYPIEKKIWKKHKCDAISKK